MKKTTAYFLILFPLYLVSCTSKKLRVQYADTYAKNVATSCNTTNDITYAGVQEVSSAQGLITTYNPTPASASNTYGFTFNVSDLRDYLENAYPQYIHFLLAGNKDNLSLLLVGVDRNGDYIYTTDATEGNSTISYYTLQSISKSTSSLILPIPAAPNKSKYIIKNLMLALDAHDANRMIQNYARNSNASRVKSFLVDAYDLKDYINKLQIDQLNAFLGMDDDNKLVLILSGTKSGSFVYGTDNSGGYYVFEHCYPCPVCNIANKGLQIENTPK